MTIIKTNISWGYVDLIKTFCQANNLDVTCIERVTGQVRSMINICYDGTTETAFNITFMSTRHLGFENMLCDYLIKCGIPPELISEGRMVVKRDMKKLDKDWEEYRKKIGLR
jgi:hypothetical protein